MGRAVEGNKSRKITSTNGGKLSSLSCLKSSTITPWAFLAGPTLGGTGGTVGSPLGCLGKRAHHAPEAHFTNRAA